MFTKLYLDTTDPQLSLYDMFTPRIFLPMVLSVVFHTLIYISGINLVYWIFLGKVLSNRINARLLFLLFVIMFFGFFARYFHVKDIYRSYNKDDEKTRRHMDRLYISWIFIS